MKPHGWNQGSVWRLVGAGLIGSILLAPGAGCQIGALIGGMASSAERSGSRDVKAKSRDLTGKTFAVIVAADRSIQAEHSDAVVLITRDMTLRLSDHAGASGVLPADEVLAFQYQRPGWVAMSIPDLVKELAVERLVFVDVAEFALNDPGNAYEWNGVAAGTISVYSDQSKSLGAPLFREKVRVTFPDNKGQSPESLPAQAVLSVLVRRFAERSAWMFYDHEEPNVIKY